MGFCRRCGDIVSGPRCHKCGGTSVAATVSWNQITSGNHQQDKWSETYVSRPKSVSPTRPKSRGPLEGHPTTTTGKRFPRPIATEITGSTIIDHRISDHIALAASYSNRPVAPLKPTVTGPKPESGILPSITPNDTTLSKVYGSVLQPKESLATHSCADCSTPFLPDATIYPDPLLDGSEDPRFLCRQCFIVNGGSKGLCPNCSKPVTILKAEGGFVYAADKYWHKKCFKCDGCSKDIGDSPMVDLLDRPSCATCFDTCLTRDLQTPKKKEDTQIHSPLERRNQRGFDSSSIPNKIKDSSPAIEELEHRLGISKSREGSPAIEELSQRLSSIGKEYQMRYNNSPCSPALDRSQTRFSKEDGSPSPVHKWERLKSPEPDEQPPVTSSSALSSPRRSTESPVPTPEAIAEMKQRFISGSIISPTSSTITLLESSPALSISPLRIIRSSTSSRNNSASPIPVPSSQFEPSSPSTTPDFLSDFSDTLTQSSFSGLDSPPRNSDPILPRSSSRYSRRDFTSCPDDVIVEETRSQLNTPNRTPQSTIKGKVENIALNTPTKSPYNNLASPTSIQLSTSISANSTCAKCSKPLFSVNEGGNFVTIPGDSENDSQVYHRDCFKCAVCHGIFNESRNGQAIFVKSSAGPAHLECAPSERSLIRKSPSANSLRFSHERTQSSGSSSTKSPSPSPLRNRSSTNYSSSRFERPPPSTPAINTSFPRFGSRTTCPGCQKVVSPMEKGVIPGPQGSRWHSDCLVCGGKQPPVKTTAWILGRGEEKKKGPGCGKKLDSAAKTDTEGRIWCRQCLLLLGVGGSPQSSPTRTNLLSQVNSSGKIPEMTGTTTLARQFTGLGSDGGLLRQLTGGSMGPTRSLSPTKQLGHMGNGVRPRPKSVIGMRNSKSVDEGRGIFLVKQLTSASSSSQWG